MFHISQKSVSALVHKQQLACSLLDPRTMGFPLLMTRNTCFLFPYRQPWFFTHPKGHPGNMALWLAFIMFSFAFKQIHRSPFDSPLSIAVCAMFAHAVLQYKSVRGLVVMGSFCKSTKIPMHCWIPVVSELSPLMKVGLLHDFTLEVRCPATHSGVSSLSSNGTCLNGEKRIAPGLCLVDAVSM
jgi:hypothetical protein